MDDCLSKEHTWLVWLKILISFKVNEKLFRVSTLQVVCWLFLTNMLCTLKLSAIQELQLQCITCWSGVGQVLLYVLLLCHSIYWFRRISEVANIKLQHFDGWWNNVDNYIILECVCVFTFGCTSCVGATGGTPEPWSKVGVYPFGAAFQHRKSCSSSSCLCIELY